MSAEDMPPDPWEPMTDNVADEVFTLARLGWRALEDITLDDLPGAVDALTEDDVRAMVFVRAIHDLADRAAEGGS